MGCSIRMSIFSFGQCFFWKQVYGNWSSTSNGLSEWVLGWVCHLPFASSSSDTREHRQPRSQLSLSISLRFVLYFHTEMRERRESWLIILHIIMQAGELISRYNLGTADLERKLQYGDPFDRPSLIKYDDWTVMHLECLRLFIAIMFCETIDREFD